MTDEAGSDKPLNAYRNKTILLAIPEDKPDISSIRWLSIWSTALKMSLASVAIPPQPRVPPALTKLGVDPQSTLNCELLDPTLGLELRWTLAPSVEGDRRYAHNCRFLPKTFLIQHTFTSRLSYLYNTHCIQLARSGKGIDV